MRLLEITLPARDPHAVVDAYAAVLEVPVSHDGPAATVGIGWSRLRFILDSTFATSHHLAITIPDDVFDDAVQWIRQRAPLLTDGAGADRFEAPPSWNARNFYWAGPEESVLELIARRDRTDAADGPFGPHHLRGVSEVGIAVQQPVTERAAALASAGLQPYGDAPGSDFAAVGDVDGMLVLAASGRAWFPTNDRPVGVVPTRIVATGGMAGVHALSACATLQLLGPARPDAVRPRPSRAVTGTAGRRLA